MDKRRIISIVILVFAFIYYIFFDKRGKETITNSEVKISGFNYLPTSTTGVIVNHDGYHLSYSEKHEQAEWVAYSLDKKDIIYANPSTIGVNTEAISISIVFILFKVSPNFCAASRAIKLW